jgi:hypothetical protein
MMSRPFPSADSSTVVYDDPSGNHRAGPKRGTW